MSATPNTNNMEPALSQLPAKRSRDLTDSLDAADPSSLAIILELQAELRQLKMEMAQMKDQIAILSAPKPQKTFKEALGPSIKPGPKQASAMAPKGQQNTKATSAEQATSA
jgi:hypothetical protein